MEDAEKACFVTDPVCPSYTHPVCQPQAPAADLDPESDVTRFVDKHRRLLIGKVENVKPIQDFLLEKEVITQADHVDLSLRTGEDTMRKLYDDLLNSNASKEMFYQALQIHERPLVDNIDAEEVELAKKDRYMIGSLICATVGAGLLWFAVYYSESTVLLVLGLTCSLGLVVAVSFLPDFYQLPRRSFGARMCQPVGSCLARVRVKEPKDAGEMFFISTGLTFLIVLIMTGFALYLDFALLLEDYYTLLWACVLFTLLAGIFHQRVYGYKLMDTKKDEGDGGEEEVEATPA